MLSQPEEYWTKNRHGLNMQVFKHAVGNSKGTAIIQHGYPSFSGCIPVQAMVTAFNDLGFNAITPNTTHNDNNSDGDYKEMTLEGHCDDLEYYVTQTINSTGFQGPLVLAGHSAGAHSALVVSVRLRMPPAFTLAVAPLISGRQYLSGWETMMEERGTGKGATFIDRWKQRGSIPYPSDRTKEKLSLEQSVMKDWKRHCLTQKRAFPINSTRIIVANKDELTPEKDTLEYFAVAKIPELFGVEGADHGFTKHKEALTTQIKNAIRSGLNL